MLASCRRFGWVSLMCLIVLVFPLLSTRLCFWIYSVFEFTISIFKVWNHCSKLNLIVFCVEESWSNRFGTIRGCINDDSIYFFFFFNKIKRKPCEHMEIRQRSLFLNNRSYSDSSESSTIFFLRELNLDDSPISGQHKLAWEVCGPTRP